MDAPATPATPATPSIKDARPLITICNRCIPYLNDDMDTYTCDAQFGAFKKNCNRCARGRHSCVEPDAALLPALNAVARTRAALARSTARGGALPADRLAAAREAADALTAKLRVLDRNRNKLTGDKPTPRKRDAAVAHGVSNEQRTLELQSLRRGVLALVEVGKGLLRLGGANQAAIDAVDRALGPDGPADDLGVSGSEEDSFSLSSAADMSE